MIVILNLTPLVHHNFLVGVPKKGKYYELINSDYLSYGGSDLYNGEDLFTKDISCNNYAQSLEIILSPLSITILKCGD